MAPAARIICVGNPLAAEDDAGSRVLARLAERPLPPGIETVDGGLGGIDLACLLEGIGVAVFVDAVAGFAPAGSVVELSPDEVMAAAPATYGHGAGLPTLFRHLGHLLDGPPPAIVVVGVEVPASENSIAQAAERSLALAAGIADHVPAPV